MWAVTAKRELFDEHDTDGFFRLMVVARGGLVRAACCLLIAFGVRQRKTKSARQRF